MSGTQSSCKRQGIFWLALALFWFAEFVVAAPTVDRPKVVFRNLGAVPVSIYWIPNQGEPRLSGTVEPGSVHRVNTTLGHRFRIEEDGNDREFVVTKQSEEVEIGISPVMQAEQGAPNILVIMGDDWSWPHASILGDAVVKTPTFDRIANEGVLFENAFTPAPSCTPSRHAVASGQYHWRLGEGVNLGGSIPAKTPVYPDLLEQAGYEIGFCRKGTAPSQLRFRGDDPFGKRFQSVESFFEKRSKNKPFCFWYGAGEPHRPYPPGSGEESGLDLERIEVPPFLPDNEATRMDLADYYLRVQKLDALAGSILEQLELGGLLENTVVVMTGDNGMPFPRAKATLYDSGTRLPLAIRWGRKINEPRRVDDLVSLTDLAPTFLEAAGIPIPREMTGRSLLPLCDGEAQEGRDFVLSGMERHVYPNPARAIRTKEFLYIRNFAPESWPTGTVEGEPKLFDFRKTPWPQVPGAFSHNIDPGPTKQFMRLYDSIQHAQAFGPRPAEELYDLRKDPIQRRNLMEIRDLSEERVAKRQELSKRLTTELRESGDPKFIQPEHATFSMRGWTIHLHDQLWAEHGAATRRALELMDGQLQRVAEVVPREALAHLQKVPIWINPPYVGTRGRAEYHGGAKWLRDNGRNPAMAKAVEVTNVKNFPFENRRMPFLMLHELAHAYHDQVIAEGFGNAELKTAFERARDSGDYDEVARFNGTRIIKDKAYAMSTPMEYFAESTEAYFGKNDFYPFDREELREHDPVMLELIETLWGVSP